MSSRFYDLPQPWHPGYSIPEYIMSEPPGRGTHTTAWLPRRTVSALPRDAKLSPGRGGVVPAAMGATEGKGKGKGKGKGLKPGFAGDPILDYGRKAAGYLMDTIQDVPPQWRRMALKALLDEIDPSLWNKAADKAKKFQSDRNLSSKEALRRGLAASMADGLAREVIAYGQGKKPPKRSQMGLGQYPESHEIMALGFLDTITDAVKDAGSAIGGAIKDAGSATWGGIKWTGGKIGSGAGSTWDAFKEGAAKAFDWGKKGLSKLGSLACGVMSAKGAGAAAAAAASSQGVPPQAGMAGAQVAKGMCSGQSGDGAGGGGPSPTGPVPAPDQGGGIPWVPIGLGVAGVGLVAFLATRK